MPWCTAAARSRIYRNGVEAGSLTSGNTFVPQGANPVLYLGGVIYSSTRNYTLQGQIDEVRLWTIARSAAEIQSEYAGQPQRG